MKISQKMILLFSAMMLLIVIINTDYLSKTNIEGSEAFTADRYRNMATNMVRNVEQYVTLMDLAIEDLTSDTAFMEAFYQVIAGDENDSAAMLANQNKMFQTMYHSAIADSFYRVSVYSDNGFYLSSHIDRNDSITSLSDDSREMIAAIPYLKAVKNAPYRRHLIGLHRDYFKLTQDISVFSAIHAITWHGKHIGYIEVTAKADELNNLLLTDNESVMIRAVLKDSSLFYVSPQDEAIYDNTIPLNTFVEYTDPCDLERNVYHVESRWLGLDIYLAEDASIRYRAVNYMTRNYIYRSLIISIGALILVVIISLGLTKSMRKLTRKVRKLPVNRLMLSADTAEISTFVTTERDKEIHELEKSFNDMLLELHHATRSEMALRESILKARLDALQAQINPHFVYNTLNVISSKGMDSNNESIVNMCEHFGQMLRYSTDTGNETATLGDELTHVRNYLMLLKARYEESLDYCIIVPEEMNDIVIPKLTLQPLVENAITYGFDKETDLRRVDIYGAMQAHQLWLEIRDNGMGFAPKVLEKLQSEMAKIEEDAFAVPHNQGHIGILNTSLRIRYYSKGAMHMELFNDHGAVVRLTMELN